MNKQTSRDRIRVPRQRPSYDYSAESLAFAGGLVLFVIDKIQRVENISRIPRIPLRSLASAPQMSLLAQPPTNFSLLPLLPSVIPEKSYDYS